MAVSFLQGYSLQPIVRLHIVRLADRYTERLTPSEPLNPPFLIRLI